MERRGKRTERNSRAGDWAVLLLLITGCGTSSPSLAPDSGSSPAEDSGFSNTADAAPDPASDSSVATTDSGDSTDPGTPADAGTADAGTATAADAGTADAAATDGGSADAGTTDGGRSFSTDTTQFFGASRCGSAGTILCEDFERGTLDPAVWTVVGTAPVIDAVHAARGKNALHISVTGNKSGTESGLRETKSFPAARDTYFGRAFFYFSALPLVASGFAHWNLVAATGTGVSGEIRLGGQMQGRNYLGVGTDSRGSATGTGDWELLDKTPPNGVILPPLGKWVCLEWEHNGADNVTKVWADAVEQPALATTATMHGGNSNPYVLPQFTELFIGWVEYQPHSDHYELWIDEIALDAQRIGCVL